MAETFPIDMLPPHTPTFASRVPDGTLRCAAADAAGRRCTAHWTGPDAKVAAAVAYHAALCHRTALVARGLDPVGIAAAYRDGRLSDADMAAHLA